jgi:hypothetical protein
MLIVQMTEQQRNNLLGFLKRVDMRGEEALAWFDLYHLLINAKPIAHELAKNPEPSEASK